jgi:hypothetical protein
MSYNDWGFKNNRKDNKLYELHKTIPIQKRTPKGHISRTTPSVMNYGTNAECGGENGTVACTLQNEPWCFSLNRIFWDLAHAVN